MYWLHLQFGHHSHKSVIGSYSCKTCTHVKLVPIVFKAKYNKKLSYRLENRASATYFFLAKLISIAHSCL